MGVTSPQFEQNAFIIIRRLPELKRAWNNREFKSARGGRLEPLDENLKQLMKELGTAINDTLSNSDKISDAITRIRGAGYDVFLVLEATIGFNKHQEQTSEELDFSTDQEKEARLDITSQDVKFLKSLKISIDEKEID
jgi:hypothetical protein